MIKLFILFLLPLSLFSAKILSYNIYDRTDRVDVMITFDTPYEGIIKQSLSTSTIAIKLQDATIESAKLKDVASKYLNSLSITPMATYTKIVAKVPKSVRFVASKTSDSYGLRLRFTTKKVSTKKSPKEQSTISPFAQLPTKKSDDISRSYYIVIAILIVGILILFFIKRKLTPSQHKQKTGSSWLFKENSSETTPDTQQNPKDKLTSSNGVSIRFQKSIDDTNSVVMLDYAEQSYLVLMGKNNVLLDRFSDNKPNTQEDFETILQDRHKELDNFLNNEKIVKNEPKEALQAYKERAAAMVYEN
ncbi:hypothetical protein N9A28_00570 [Sulfurimonas sp.]|nr:hypothetical protein [Sulfurimonas sp.]